LGTPVEAAKDGWPHDRREAASGKATVAAILLSGLIAFLMLISVLIAVNKFVPGSNFSRKSLGFPVSPAAFGLHFPAISFIHVLIIYD